MMNTCAIEKNEKGCFLCSETTLWIDEQLCLKCQWNVDCSGDKIICAFPKFENKGEK